MRNFEYSTEAVKLLDPEIVSMLAEIHEHKGKQELFLDADIDELSTLLEVAKIQSTEASNKIEGIHTTDKRLREIVKQKSEPRNRSEEEIAGYRDVLQTVHDNYGYMDVSSGLILQLHRDLYSFSNGAAGGHYKLNDNVITETDIDGNERIRFVQVPEFQTQEVVENVCTAFVQAWKGNRIDKLLLVPMFILDFLCIHPFDDGNGRLSRLLTLLLYYKAGYIVGKYISLELLIEKSRSTYYEALQNSSTSWHEGKNDYAPFVEYYLGIMIKAYGEFEARVTMLQDRNLSKPDRIRAVIEGHTGKITKKEIMDICPDISKITVERTLNALLKAGQIDKVGRGPATGYISIEINNKI